MPTPDEMRARSLDEYIEWMLANGYYDADINSSVVWNARSGQPLVAFPNAAGYPSVNLVFTRTVVRRATVHRMVAIKAWGADQVCGKQVGHIDGNRSDSRIQNLWLPATAAEHVFFDGTHRNLVFRNVAKAEWAPCVRCGDPNGRISHGCKTPDRISGERFGIEGAICRRCYGALQERERRARKRSK